jgi:hypothetical protein
MSEASSESLQYRVVDKKEESVIVLPLTKDVTSKNIECKVKNDVLAMLGPFLVAGLRAHRTLSRSLEGACC